MNGKDPWNNEMQYFNYHIFYLIFIVILTIKDKINFKLTICAYRKAAFYIRKHNTIM